MSRIHTNAIPGTGGEGYEVERVHTFAVFRQETIWIENETFIAPVLKSTLDHDRYDHDIRAGGDGVIACKSVSFVTSLKCCVCKQSGRKCVN